MGMRKRNQAAKYLSVLVAAVQMVVLVVLPSFATAGAIDGSSFEGIDGNAAAAGGTDWNSVDPQTNIVLKTDKDTGAVDDSFGQGAKEDTPVPSVVDGSIPPNKSDLKQFGSYKEENSSGKFLHLFWTRVQDPSGTTNMDFELNQKSCVAGGNVSGCSTNGVTPTRTPGDLLITYDLSNGGSTAIISLRRWTAAGWGPSGPLSATVASGSINNEAQGPVTLTKTGETYSLRTFGEASINLNQIFTSQTCQTFGSAYLKSRSSDSFTAATKDFIAPTAINLTNCGRLVVKKRIGSATGALLAGAGFTINPANENGVTAMTETATGSGVFCIDNLRLAASYTVTETTVPFGFSGSAPQSLTATTASGCADVSASTAADANFINSRLQGFIDIVKRDDTAPTALPVGGATFTAYVDANPASGTNSTTARGAEDTVVGGSCQTDVAGLCSTAAMNTGWYWVVETVTPPGYVTAADQRINVAADAQHYTATFVNPRKFKVITLVCKEATNTLYKSTVAFDGSASTNTLGAGATLPSGVTEAMLCGLGGASFGGKTASTTAKTGTVTIAPSPAP